MFSYHFWWNLFPIIGLLIWGSLGITENLWYDEGYSAALIQNTVGDIVSITAQDVHSPFYYLTLKGWWNMWGSLMGLRSLKWFSIVGMIGYILLGKFYVKKLFGEKVSVWFMFYSIVMPIMVVQSGNVRMYTMALFFVTAAGLLMLDILRGPAGWKKWCLLTFAGIGGVYSHTYAMLQLFLMYLLFFCALLGKKKYDCLKGYFISGICIALAFLPWLSVLVKQMQGRAAEGGALTQDVWPLVYDMLKRTYREWFSALETPIIWVQRTEFFLCLFLFLCGAGWMLERKNAAPLLGVTALGVSVLVGVLIYVFTGQGFFGRYFFPAFGALILMYAVGMERIRFRWCSTAVAVVALICFFAQYRTELALEYDTGLDEWKKFMEENVGEDDLIMASSVHSLFLSVYFPEKDYMIYGYRPDYSPYRDVEAFWAWNQIEGRTGNIWFLYLPEMGCDPNVLSERYTWEEAVDIHYMFYHFGFARMYPIASADG